MFWKRPSKKHSGIFGSSNFKSTCITLVFNGIHLSFNYFSKKKLILVDDLKIVLSLASRVVTATLLEGKSFDHTEKETLT